MDNKKILIWVLVTAGIIMTIFLVTNHESNVTDPNGTADLESISPSPTPTPTPTYLPLQPTKAPKPTLIVETDDYKYWFDRLDPESRVIAVYSECDYLVPSNLTYSNNTDIMLDNTRSSEDHVLKIGDKEYPLKAGEWRITTLHNSTGPVRWPIFCKGIEMGEIELK